VSEDWVNADDFYDVPSLLDDDRRQDDGSTIVRVVPFDDFISSDEPDGDPLLGTSEETALSVGGKLVAYGTGGAGKTTLAIDGMAHMAAGADEWLGIAIPRPVRFVVIENEGPRGQFRRKLRAKREAWTGASFGENVRVLEEPWSRFTFDEASHRGALAEALNDFGADVLLCGPLTTLGMIGGGTPDEVNAFDGLLGELAALLDRKLALWLIHHENKTGQISGAWERWPDALLHVTSRGNGHTRLFWQKARWSSAIHGTTMHLAWSEGSSYQIEEPADPATPERVYDDMAAFVLANGGCTANAIQKGVTGSRGLKIQKRDQLLAEGVLINGGKGHSFLLWHRDDPGRPTLDQTVQTVRSDGSLAGSPDPSPPAAGNERSGPSDPSQRDGSVDGRIASSGPVVANRSPQSRIGGRTVHESQPPEPDLASDDGIPF
jgi:hypothetical protein